jgi:hypothetical protein
MSKWIGKFSTEVQMANKYTGKWSTYLAIREMKMKMTQRIHLTPSRKQIDKRKHNLYAVVYYSVRSQFDIVLINEFGSIIPSSVFGCV